MRLDTYLSPFLNGGSPAYGFMNLLYAGRLHPDSYVGSKTFTTYADSAVQLGARMDWTSTLRPGYSSSTSISPAYLPGGPSLYNVAASVSLSHVQWAPLPWGDYGTLTIYDVAHPPGSAPSFPLLPAPAGTRGWQFRFGVGDTSTPTFIDPLVAVGYDYLVDSGPNFASVLLPSVGDNQYDLWLWNSTMSSWADTGIDLTGGSRYDFAAGGVDRFRILGIETAAGLDPQDDTAFVTGLWFTGTGSVTMRQIPVTFGTTVPAPGALVLVSMGVAGLSVVRKKLA